MKLYLKIIKYIQIFTAINCINMHKKALWFLKYIEMKKCLLFTIICLLLFSLNSLAQERTISGEVHDFSTDDPVIGATVIVPGTGMGTTTNESGAFSLSIPTDVEAIKISYVGYAAKKVLLDTSSSYIILLKTTENSLKQLVVVGYGSQKKGNLTGAVSTVDVKKTF